MRVLTRRSRPNDGQLRAANAPRPVPMASIVLALAMLAACLTLSACGGTGANEGGGSDGGAAATDSGSIEVPDVSGEDGAQAVSDVEDAGLQSTLADAHDDPGFDTSRDATDCEVTDQDPAAGGSVSEDDEVTITVDCAQVDWSNQEGAQWDAFNDAYQSSFDDGCQELFDQSPNGSLYEDNVEYTVIDCQNENPGDAADASDVPTDVPDDPEGDGANLGELDGCQALFENQSVTSLNYGTDSITEADCPIGAAASAAPPTHKPRAPNGSRPLPPASVGYVHCDANISAKADTTSCGFAANVFYEFWSSGEATALHAYSPATHKTYEVHCTVRKAKVACSTLDGSAVRFSQASVDAYSQSQADHYAATHDLGP